MYNSSAVEYWYRVDQCCMWHETCRRAEKRGVNGGLKKWVGRGAKREVLSTNGYRERIGLPMIDTGDKQPRGCEMAVKVSKIMEDGRWRERLGNGFYGELLVAVDHNQLRTMAQETGYPIGSSHPTPSWALPNERLVHIINRCSLSSTGK